MCVCVCVSVCVRVCVSEERLIHLTSASPQRGCFISQVNRVLESTDMDMSVDHETFTSCMHQSEMPFSIFQFHLSLSRSLSLSLSLSLCLLVCVCVCVCVCARERE